MSPNITFLLQKNIRDDMEFERVGKLPKIVQI